jgi:hypothetical protein
MVNQSRNETIIKFNTIAEYRACKPVMSAAATSFTNRMRFLWLGFMLTLLFLFFQIQKVAAADSAAPVEISGVLTNAMPSAALSANPDSTDGNEAVHVVFVNNGSLHKVDVKDGVFFPKSGGDVSVRRLKYDQSITLMGLPVRPFGIFNSQLEISRTYMYRELNLGEFTLILNNGSLTAKGQLADPVLLTFEDQAFQQGVLLWPVGCAALFDADCDTRGGIHIRGGDELQAIFGNATDLASNKVVQLCVTLNSTGCVTNLLAGSRDFNFDCLAEFFAQAHEQVVEAQKSLDTVATFEKLLQSADSQTINFPFWKELDQKCQLITQGRLGILEYGFGDDHANRQAACQAVLGDLAAAPGLTPTTKNLVETTLTLTNLSIMEAITEKLGEEKSMAQISAQLKSQQQKLLGPGLPSLAGEFQYMSAKSQGTITLGLLNFDSIISKTQDRPY